MYNREKYLKILPLQPVSSKGNLQVVDLVGLYICVQPYMPLTSAVNKELFDTFKVVIHAFDCFKVLDLVRSCNGLAQYLFLHNAANKIGAQEALLLLKPMLSPVGHHKRPNEEIVLSKFVEFMHSVEGT